MLTKINYKDLFYSNHGWLESRFHFSFSEYYDPNKLNFGSLRVINDDIVHPHSGFDTHPHKNMEIISYIIKGAITHKDSMGNSETLRRGQVQYLSAGTGITHSEYNNHDEDLRLLQIWIIPPENSLPKLYGSHHYTEEERKNKLLNIVSGMEGNAKIKIYQDANLFACELDPNKHIDYKIAIDKQIYFVQIEGSSRVNGINLGHGDALTVVNENSLTIKADEYSHFLFIEVNN